MLEDLNSAKNKLITSISSIELANYVAFQCNNFFPDNKKIITHHLIDYVKNVLDKIEFCFQHVKLEYYNKNNHPFFNFLNGDHYCIFLSYLTRYIYVKSENINLASKIFLLNKSLHGIDSFYGISLPDIFIVCHPIGTVLGNAQYNDKMIFYQNVTVGSTSKGIFPKFSTETILYSNSSVIGDCRIGKNVIIGANSSVINLDVQDDSVVLGNYPNNRIIKSKKQINQIFR